MPGLDSEAIDFRAASESFAAVRKLARRDLETLRIVTDHQGRKVPTVGGMILFGKDRERDFPAAALRLRVKDILDAWIAFEALSFETTERIVDQFIDELRVQLRAKNVGLELMEPGCAWLAKNGYDRSFGARPMSRLIHSKIKKPLVDAILFGKLQDGGTVVVGASGDTLTLAY